MIQYYPLFRLVAQKLKIVFLGSYVYRESALYSRRALVGA